MRAKETDGQSRTNAKRKGFFGGEKTKTLLWNASSEVIGAYFWLLKFSNVLLKLIQ